MDKDRIVGSGKRIKGAVKQAVGKAVGDAKLESEGKADDIEGKVQNTIGCLKDTLKGRQPYPLLCSESEFSFIRKRATTAPPVRVELP
jgi:uncharacterized protein YjbJ (UPF0337 family)